MLRASLFSALGVAAAIALCDRGWAGPNDIPDRPPPLTFDKPVDYVAWYNDFVRRGRDEKDNAYPIYLKLCPDAIGQGGFRQPTGNAAEQFEKAVGRVWTAEEFPDLAVYLSDCERHFGVLEKAATTDAFWISHLDPAIGLVGEGPPLFPAGPQCIKALIRRSWLKDVDQFRLLLEAWETSLENGSLFAQQPTLVIALAAGSIRSVVRQQVLDALAAGLFTSTEQLQQVYSLLLQFDAEPYDWGPVFLVEWARLLHRLQGLTRDGKLDAVAWAQFVAYTAAPLIWGETLPDPATTARLIDNYHAELLAILQEPLAPRRILRLDKFERKWDDRRERNAFLSRAMYAQNLVHFTTLQHESESCGTRAMLAVHVYRAKYGRWPESLREIDGSLGLKRIELQTIEPFNTKPFVYKLKNGEPWLYSVGWNLQDDNGKHDALFGKRTDADYRFWPRPK